MKNRQKRAIESRGRILTAAETCFAEHGYEGTSVAQICQAAGMSKGAFYHHFASKQQVFLELLEQWLSGFQLQMDTVWEREQDIPTRLLGMSSLLPEVLLQAEEHFPIYLEFWMRAMRDPLVRGVLIEPLHRYREFIVTMVENGIEQGSLKPNDPNTVATAILAVALGLLLQGVFDSQTTNWTTVSRDSIQMLLEGLQ
jgi:AcrR family transcriptional regulator